ncbi:ATP-dependent DNA ligase [Paenibacillus xylaniclasticus]|uniref:ATP-dependent DNA ligase n=1 Tax=Paenibacillus xylaniclasticus TaxID=588083 RepID=UPI000FD6E412|nr:MULTISPECIES: RNA ligase family protein [Paenibacillus]GFN29829.1 DNA ligase [Paenibacillus curdlanolyticus]
MKAVVPFEPILTDRVPQGSSWVSQIKWDGVRMLTYYDGSHVRLMNRSLNERTLQYPELTDIRQYCSSKSVILDGEIIALDRSRPSFHLVMRRDSVRKAAHVARAVQEVRITYMVFDILYLNGQWVTDRTLQQRQQLLAETIKPTGEVQLVQNIQDGESLFSVMKQHEMEGIVCKDLTSTYIVNGKDARWQKKKVIRDLVAVVGGVTMRDGRVNALLLGLYDDNGELIYIGHAGTGRLTVNDWTAVTAIADSIRTHSKPFKNTPERSAAAIWLKPLLKVKINYMEWSPHRILRQPSIQAFVEKQDSECTFDQL